MAGDDTQMNLQNRIEDVSSDQALTSSTAVLAVVSGMHSERAMSEIMAIVPRSARWWGRRDRPWGLGDDFVPRLARAVNDLETVRMGKSSWFFRADGQRSYDTLREAFVGERLNGGGHNCGCISAYAFGEATVDCDAQLELLRDVMARILREMPNLDLASLCADVFAGQRQLCEHYLWWLENEAFVAHPVGQERQDRLLLTDEGCVALAMLEMTKPGSNIDLSPKAVHDMRRRGALTLHAKYAHTLRKHQKKGSARWIEDTTRRLMGASGLTLDRVRNFLRMEDYFTFDLDRGRQYACIEWRDGVLTCSAGSLAASFRLENNNLTVYQTFPDTLMMGFKGRKLGEIVEHSWLPPDAIITKAVRNRNGTKLALKVAKTPLIWNEGEDGEVNG